MKRLTPEEALQQEMRRRRLMNSAVRDDLRSRRPSYMGPNAVLYGVELAPSDAFKSCFGEVETETETETGGTTGSSGATGAPTASQSADTSDDLAIQQFVAKRIGSWKVEDVKDISTTEIYTRFAARSLTIALCINDLYRLAKAACGASPIDDTFCGKTQSNELCKLACWARYTGGDLRSIIAEHAAGKTYYYPDASFVWDVPLVGGILTALHGTWLNLLDKVTSDDILKGKALELINQLWNIESQLLGAVKAAQRLGLSPRCLIPEGPPEKKTEPWTFWETFGVIALTLGTLGGGAYLGLRYYDLKKKR